jgi:antitoxin HigA-1
MRQLARKPTHPGAILKLDVLPALGLTVTQVAADLGISRQILHRILSEKSPITAEMALRLGKYLGNGPDVWLNMQKNYDLRQAEKRLGHKLGQIGKVKENRSVQV